jgi:hypothetical protein
MLITDSVWEKDSPYLGSKDEYKGRRSTDINGSGKKAKL